MLKRFLRTSSVYFVGTVLSKVVGFLLLPLYTAMLSPREFGEFDFWMNLMTFLAPIVFFQVWDATYRLNFLSGEDPVRVASTGAILMLCGFLVYGFLMVPILVLLGAPHLWLVVGFGLTLVVQYFMGYFARAALRNSLFVISGVLNTLVNAGVSVALLFGGLGPQALFLGLICGNLVQIGLLVGFLRPDRFVRLSKVDRGLARRLLAFSFPLCITSAAYWLLTGWTRLQVLSTGGAEEVGLLAVGFRFGLMVSALTSVLVYAWNELLYLSEREAGGRKELHTQGAKIIVVAGLLATSLVVLGAHMSFDLFVADAYEGARHLVTPLVIATSFNAIATLLGSIFMSESETQTLLWSTVAASGPECRPWVLGDNVVRRRRGGDGSHGFIPGNACLALGRTSKELRSSRR